MPTFRPFRALRYDPQRVGDVSAVLAPPYDVIGPEAQAALHAASPHNVVRLIRGRETPTDTDADNVYTRARRTFDAWREQGLLRHDAQPAFYVVEHAFRWHGRTRRRLGVLGLLELAGADHHSLLRHEATLAAPRADRTRLLDAVPANLSPIFCVTPDADGRLQAAVGAVARQGQCALRATVGDDTVRCWVVRDPAAQGAIQAAAADAAWLIADGHHRFEVAWSRRERYGAVMTYLVSMRDAGLLVRAIHRLLHAPTPPAWEALEPWCVRRPQSSLAAVEAWLAEPAAGPAHFGYVEPAGYWAVALREPRLAQWNAEAALPDGIADLDVSILHGGLLPAQGIAESALTYEADAAAAARAVQARQAAGAWLLRPLDVATVYRLASRGRTLPPKSTFFFPKVPSGVAFNPFDVMAAPVR